MSLTLPISQIRASSERVTDNRIERSSIIDVCNDLHCTKTLAFVHAFHFTVDKLDRGFKLARDVVGNSAVLRLHTLIISLNRDFLKLILLFIQKGFSS